MVQFFYVCVCTGRHCEIYKDPCLKVRCQNGGRCESVGLNASCACPSGYQGEHPLVNGSVKFRSSVKMAQMAPDLDEPFVL